MNSGRFCGFCAYSHIAYLFGKGMDAVGVPGGEH